MSRSPNTAAAAPAALRLLMLPLLLLVPAAASGQDGLNLQLVPKIGVFTPLGSLTEDTEMESTLALGAAAELTLPRLPFNLRVNVDHATRAPIVARGSDEGTLGHATITNVVGNLVLRPLPPAATFQPYFFGGGGVKLYSLSASGGLLPAGPDRTASRGTLHIGGGVDVRVGPLALLLEISDYISTFEDATGASAGTVESRLQNHLYGMLGFRVTMF